ncbi:hypothetical protein B0A49_03591 [Cryomyces minteri]|uniref:MINDY deubiquitinase domain-containing protein n=1 Tax=Cryomyces minteri TaxID=331657 RepID=A0A4U0XHF8_9PEZI|nr:hypothetical protein B0A49_03591 [Cryomyces minteri]
MSPMDRMEHTKPENSPLAVSWSVKCGGAGVAQRCQKPAPPAASTTSRPDAAQSAYASALEHNPLHPSSSSSHTQASVYLRALYPAALLLMRTAATSEPPGSWTSTAAERKMVTRKPVDMLPPPLEQAANNPPYPSSPTIYSSAVAYPPTLQGPSVFQAPSHIEETQRPRSDSVSTSGTWDTNGDEDQQQVNLPAPLRVGHPGLSAETNGGGLPTSLRAGPPEGSRRTSQESNRVDGAAESLVWGQSVGKQGTGGSLNGPLQSHNPYRRTSNAGQNGFGGESSAAVWDERVSSSSQNAPPPPSVELPSEYTPIEQTSGLSLDGGAVPLLDQRAETSFEGRSPGLEQPPLIPALSGSFGGHIDDNSTNPWETTITSEDKWGSNPPIVPAVSKPLLVGKAEEGYAPALPPRGSFEDIEHPPPKPPRPTSIDVSHVGRRASQPEVETPQTKARRQRSEHYPIKHINWYDEPSRHHPRRSPILIQNANGPCPLLALVNALVLSTPAGVETALIETLRTREQVSLGLLLDAVFDELMSGRRGDAAHELPDVGDLAARTFEDAQNIQFLEEELEQKLRNHGLSSGEQQLFEDVTSIKQFLASWPTQLTDYGLSVLSKFLKPGHIAILFRNDHFSTLYKDPRTDALMTLVTDAGYASHDEIVWESLVDVNGTGSELFSGDFRPVGNSTNESAAGSRGGSHPHGQQSHSAFEEDVGWQTVRARNTRSRQDAAANVDVTDAGVTQAQETGVIAENAIVPPASATTDVAPSAVTRTTTEQEDHDLALAMQLQEEEEDRHRLEQRDRRRNEELSRQFLERETRNQGPAVGQTQAIRCTPVPGQQEVRPLIPPRRNNMDSRRSGPNNASQVSNAPPPTYEQAASDQIYHPPIGPPTASPAALNRQQSAYAQQARGQAPLDGVARPGFPIHGRRGSSRRQPSLVDMALSGHGAGPARRRQSSGQMPGGYGDRIGGTYAGPNMAQDRRDDEKCVVM